MLESNGEAVFHRPFFNLNLDAVESLMARDWVVPGLGDAGAHVSQIMDSGCHLSCSAIGSAMNAG